MVESLLQAAAIVFSWPDILLIPVGVFVGLLAGVVPGVNAPIAMAILLPVTYGMDPVRAMMLLVPIIGASDVGGSVTAILTGVPGDAVNIATTIDGHALARKGRAAEAIAASATGSAMGSLLGLVVLVAVLPIMRTVALLFGPPEIFLVAITAILALSALSKGNVLDGLIAGATGLLISSIGFNPVLGGLRYTFGVTYLWDGIELTAFFLGMYGITESIQLAAGRQAIAPIVYSSMGNLFAGVRAVFRHWGLLLRSSAIGVTIGAVPVLGGTVAALVGYASAKRTAKDPESFGTGDIRGVIAPESANDAKDGGALITTLALGVPGSQAYVVLLGAFLLHGILPGRQLMVEHLDVVWTIILAMVVGNVLRSTAVLVAGPALAQVTRVPTAYMSPIILMTCIVGAYAIRGNPLDALVATGFGILGLLLERFGISRIVAVIAFVLAPIAERSLFQSLQISGNDWLIFVRTPLSMILVLLIGLTVARAVYPLIRRPAREGAAKPRA